MSAADALLADREGVRSGGSSSKFKGVSWDRKNQKWKAQICIDGKSTYLGIFDNEEEAARKYDENAAYLGKTVNFPAEHGVVAEAVPKGGPSKYRGVSWSKSKRKWITQINIDGKPTYLGAFDSEEEAALKYDEHASYLGRAVNFPSADGQGLAEKGGSHGGSSKFKGVSWIKSKEKWLAQINVDGKNTYLGIFESEEEAARKYDERAVALGRVLNFPDVGGVSAAAAAGAIVGGIVEASSSSSQKHQLEPAAPPPPPDASAEAVAVAEASAPPSAVPVAVPTQVVELPASVTSTSEDSLPAAKRAKTTPPPEGAGEALGAQAVVADSSTTAAVAPPPVAPAPVAPPATDASTAGSDGAAAAAGTDEGAASEAEHTEQVNMLMKEQEAMAQSMRTRDTELALLLLAQGGDGQSRKPSSEAENPDKEEGAHI